MSWGLREHLQGMLWTTFVKCAKCRCRFPYLSHLYRDGLFPLIKTQDEDWHVILWVRLFFHDMLVAYYILMETQLFISEQATISRWGQEYNLWNIIIIRAVTVCNFFLPRWSSNKYRGLAVNRTNPQITPSPFPLLPEISNDFWSRMHAACKWTWKLIIIIK